MEKDEGFFKLYISFFSHELWKENREYNKAEAWLWLLSKVKITEGAETRFIAKKPVRYNKGEYAASISYLARAWKWSSGRVRVFLNYLTKEGMITINTNQGACVFTFLNHAKHNPHLYPELQPQKQPLFPTPAQPQPSPHAQSAQSYPPPRGGGVQRTPEDATPRAGESHSAAEQPAPQKGSDQTAAEKPTPSQLKELTTQLITYWNEENGTTLRASAQGRDVQVRQRRKTFTVDEIKEAIYNRAHDPWTKANNQQANWDALFKSDKAMDGWRNRPPSGTEAQQQTHPLKRGFLTKPAAQAYFNKRRKTMDASSCETIKHEGTWYYKPLI